MYPEDYEDFLHIIQLIEAGKLDKTSERCFITGILAGINCDLPEVYEYLSGIFEFNEDDEINLLLGSVDKFEN